MHRQSASRSGRQRRLLKSRRTRVSPSYSFLRRLLVESLEERWLLNGAPIASDDTYSVGEVETLLVSAPGVLANDTDPDGDLLTVSSVDTSGTLGNVT